MPERACERGFCHLIAFSQFFGMPQNRRTSFSVEMPHFSYLILGHFKKFEHKKVGH